MEGGRVVPSFISDVGLTSPTPDLVLSKLCSYAIEAVTGGVQLKKLCMEVPQ